jgi:putative membrane protein (TIGR04086 family)
MKHRRFLSKKKTNIKTLIFGFTLNCISFVICALVLALIISTTKNPLAFIGYTSLALLIACGAISGFFTSKYKGEHGTVTAGLSSLIFAILLIFCGLIINGGGVKSVTLINFLLYVISAFLFAFIGSKRKKHRR